MNNIKFINAQKAKNARRKCSSLKMIHKLSKYFEGIMF